MSELQFPKDPIVGQEYDFPPYRYYWDGIKWKTKGVRAKYRFTPKLGKIN